MMSIIESNHWRLLVAKLPNGTGKLHHEVIFAFLSPPKIPEILERRFRKIKFATSEIPVLDGKIRSCTLELCLHSNS